MTSLCGVVDFKHGPMMPSAADHRGSQVRSQLLRAVITFFVRHFAIEDVPP